MSLSFLETAEIFVGPFLIGHCISQGTISYFQGSQVSTLEGPLEALWSTQYPIWMSALSAPWQMDSQYLHQCSCVWGDACCCWLWALSLTNKVLCWIVGETACSPLCCGDVGGQCLVLVAWASKYGVNRGIRDVLFFPGAIFSPFPLGRV